MAFRDSYFCASEAKCDSHMETFLRLHEASGEARLPSPLQGHEGVEAGAVRHQASGPHWWPRLGGGLGSHTQSSLLPEKPGGPSQVPGDADLLGDLDLKPHVAWLCRGQHLSRAWPRPPGWRCCPAWPLGMTTPHEASLTGRACSRPQVLPVSEAQWVPSSFPVRAHTCEYSRTGRRGPPRGARWGQHVGALTGSQTEAASVSRPRRPWLCLGPDERRCDWAASAARQEGRRWREHHPPPAGALSAKPIPVRRLWGGSWVPEAPWRGTTWRAWAGLLLPGPSPPAPARTWPAPSLCVACLPAGA